ncbi:MAG TPA: TolC family protein [Pirellulales bacterium]
MIRLWQKVAVVLGVVASTQHVLLAQQSQQRATSSRATRVAMQSLPPAGGGYEEVVPRPVQSGQGVSIAAPEGASLTLDQASELAVRNNPILVRARAQIDSKMGIAIQAGIPPNPRYDTNNPQVFAGGQSQYNAGFCQEVPVKGKLRLDRAAAMQDVEQARMGYIRQRFELLTAVRQQFYHMLAQERRVAVLEQLVQIASKSHSAAQQREKAGQVAETDVLLLLTELQQAQIALENSRTILAGARRALAATMGIPAFPIQDALGDLTANLPKFDEEPMRQFIATRNAAVVEAQLQIAQNRFLYQRARVEPYPNPYVGPAIAFGPSSGSNGGNGAQLWINMQMNIPVWNLNQGNIRAANANIRDSVASVGVLQNDLLRQAAETLATYRTARDRSLRIGEEILPTAERTQRLVRNAYDVGQMDVAPVLQAQRALTQVNLDYIETLETAWMSAATLAGLLQVESFP